MARIEVPPELEIVRVTPDLAAEWLEKYNDGNRRLSRSVIATYARDMLNDNWRLTHQSIAFDDEGRLLDGQHRLAAVVEADVPVDFTVQRGWDRETFSVVDTGFKRAASHFIDAPNSALMAAAARILATIKDGGPPGVVSARATPQDVLAAFHEWPELIEMRTNVERVYEDTRISKTLHLVVLAQAQRSRYADAIPAWADGLASGVDLSDKDPRRLLRQRWMRELRYLNSSMGRGTGYALIVKAWNAFATEAEIQHLRSRGIEELPRIAGLSKGRSK